jgi:hypothetical protein
LSRFSLACSVLHYHDNDSFLFPFLYKSLSLLHNFSRSANCQFIYKEWRSHQKTSIDKTSADQ